MVMHFAFFRRAEFDFDVVPQVLIRQSGEVGQLVEFGELGNVLLADAHLVLAVQELAAGAALQHLALALEQRAPHLVVGVGVLVPGLLDHRRGVDRHGAFVGAVVFDALRLGHGGGTAEKGA